MGRARTENKSKQILDTLNRVSQESRANCTNVIRDTDFTSDPSCPDSDIRVIQMCTQKINNTLDVLTRDIGELVNQIRSDVDSGMFSSTDTRFFYEVDTNLRNLTDQNVQISGVNILETSRLLGCRIRWEQKIDQDVRLQLAKMLDIYTRLQNMVDSKQKGFNPVPFIIGIAAVGIIVLLIVKQVRGK